MFLAASVIKLHNFHLCSSCTASTIIAILLGHEHLIWVTLPFPLVQCCLQTIKVSIPKEFGQIVLSNIEWGKGAVCGPMIYDSDCSYHFDFKLCLKQTTAEHKIVRKA